MEPIAPTITIHVKAITGFFVKIQSNAESRLPVKQNMSVFVSPPTPNFRDKNANAMFHNTAAAGCHRVVSAPDA